MSRLKVLSVAVACLTIAAATAGIHASGHQRTLVVTMTNDQNSNQISVYDAESHALLQTLSTRGKGGAGGNARGIKQYDRRLVAPGHVEGGSRSRNGGRHLSSPRQDHGIDSNRCLGSRRNADTVRVCHLP